MISPERFTDQAREALGRAQERVVRLRHPALDTDHLLLALVGQPEGLVAEALKRLGVDAALAATGLETVLSGRPRGNAAPGGPYITTRAKAALDAAAADAQQRGDAFIGTEHLILAALSGEETVGTRILADLGLGREALAAVFEQV